VTTSALKIDLDPVQRSVLQDLSILTYDQVEAKYGWSRGRIYNLAKRMNARKTEARIAERRAERERRQRDALEALINTTATADVLDYLDDIPNDCAQLVCTSVPYNIGKPYCAGASADSMRHVYYLGWLMQIMSEAARILRDGGTLFLQVGSTRDESDTLVPIDILIFDAIKRTGLIFQSRVAWVVGHGLTPKRRLSERYETALIFSKGEPAIFNPAPARTPQKQPGKRSFKGPNKGRLSGHPQGAWPSNVWNIPNVGHNHPERTGHPAQFPLELARRAVQLYTNPGDLVIDPFSGSGTTHVACIETHRSFSGCDLFYETIRDKRIAAANPDDVCSLPGISDQSAAIWQAEARRIDIPAPGAQLSLV
jgi:DNA modification methylase